MVLFVMDEKHFYLVDPSKKTYNFNGPVGTIRIGEIKPNSNNKALKIPVEIGPCDSYKWKDPDVKVTFSWLKLDATIKKGRQVGNVNIDEREILPIDAISKKGTWLWELLPEDIEMVENSRKDNPKNPLWFYIEITGIAKVLDPDGKLLDVFMLNTPSTEQFKIELSLWERLVESLGYKFPPSQEELASAVSLNDPSWTKALEKLKPAQDHFRAGEDYAALRECLTVLESFVSSPYNPDRWKPLLNDQLDKNKVEALTRLFSGLATYCNKAHHKNRDTRDTNGDLESMELSYWEADLILGISQFVTTYALRLRSLGLLSEKPKE